MRRLREHGRIVQRQAGIGDDERLGLIEQRQSVVEAMTDCLKADAALESKAAVLMSLTPAGKM